MSVRRLGGRRPASGDVLGDFLRDALPGHVHRGALSGPPSVRCPGRSHRITGAGRVLLILLTDSDSGAVLSERPAGSRGGNPHRDMGRRPDRRPVGGPATGRLPLFACRLSASQLPAFRVSAPIPGAATGPADRAGPLALGALSAPRPAGSRAGPCPWDAASARGTRHPAAAQPAAGPPAGPGAVADPSPRGRPTPPARAEPAHRAPVRAPTGRCQRSSTGTKSRSTTPV